MIIRILGSSATFNGVRYNTDKINSGRGELMVARNFGYLEGLSEVRPEDYKHYFQSVAGLNSRVKKPQLHAAISTHGREHSKQELTAIAEKWLKEMGYGDQPYLIIFHNDTDNHHVHIVSVRVDREGKKIRDSHEKYRAVAALDRIMGVDEQKRISDALKYNFTTLAQFKLILEQQGFKIRDDNGKLFLTRSGNVVNEVPVEDIKFSAPDKGRQQQLKALFHKYNEEQLQEKFGIKLVFHAKDGKPAFGYTIIDHAKKNVFKGSEIMPLAEFLNKTPDKPFPKEPEYIPTPATESKKEVFSYRQPGTSTVAPPQISLPGINIARDVDDEAIYGKRRQRRKKGRSSSR